MANTDFILDDFSTCLICLLSCTRLEPDRSDAMRFFEIWSFGLTFTPELDFFTDLSSDLPVPAVVAVADLTFRALSSDMMCDRCWTRMQCNICRIAAPSSPSLLERGLRHGQWGRLKIEDAKLALFATLLSFFTPSYDNDASGTHVYTSRRHLCSRKSSYSK